ncbi:MAG: alpha,alpha-trehalase TreF [Cyclobacteriaceae bacterium]|nr:alpha,alpha-trehalase TreF [Cyclobacteriaceae bacterium]
MPVQLHTSPHTLQLLFEAVQLQNIFEDGKTFPDCLPKRSLAEIASDYEAQKNVANFDLKKFVLQNFSLPEAPTTTYQSDSSHSASEHIHELWNVLMRKPDQSTGALIPLPHPYVVPGGRFREIYYWDSFFTLLGLKVSGRTDLIQHMVKNFAYLIDTVGYIPNGNRTYYLGRSQPPFFALMVNVLAGLKKNILPTYLPQLEKEYNFWMRGSTEVTATQPALHRVVRMPDGSLLNRYWDEHDTPRPESYKEDVELARHAIQKPEVLYRHLRAAAESGWDFSSRWFKDENLFSTIHTTEIIPVDLNCLLFYLEKLISLAHHESGNQTQATKFLQLANTRKAAIRAYCWNVDQNFFVDYDFVAQQQKQALTLAAVFPLYFELATPEQALGVETILGTQFLRAGGLTTTLFNSGQQWDAPNGWAPLQWMSYRGLLNYGFDELANEIKNRWLKTNEKVYTETGKMMEKYNVYGNQAEGGGGEYPNQDGFGWTNGVYLAMQEL